MTEMRNRGLEAMSKQWKAKGYTDAEVGRLTDLMSQSGAFHPALQLQDRLERIKDGRLSAVPWPWPGVTQLCPSLIPGSVTLLAGSPGASKSFAVLQCLCFWSERGYESALYALEGTRSQHLQRMLAQLDGNSGLTDMEWVRLNPKEVDEAFARHTDWLDTLGQSITCPISMDAVTHDSILQWLRDQAGHGVRIAVIDPVTVADTDGKPWVEDKRLVYAIKRIAEQHGLSVVLVTHPAKNTAGPDLDGLSGGAAYQRHVDAVLWLQAVDSKHVMTVTPCGRSQIEITRVMHLLKVRDGRGQGKVIGFRFEPGSLLLSEQGVIIREAKEARNT